MNNESSVAPASFASGYATVTKVGQLAIFNYFPGRNHDEDESDKNKNQNTVKQCIDLCFSLDNSLSMGGLTKRAAEIFCHGLVGKIPGCDTRGTLVAFDTKGYVILSNFTNSAAISSVDFPKQGMTNITAGVDLAIESITENHRNDARKAGRAATNLSTVHCLVFVSDGIHNTGPKITDQHIKAWRNKIDTLNLRLAVIVVGIDSNDTSLGMQIKSGLENVRIKGLAPVYYAKNGDDMQIVLTSLVDCLSKSFAGSAVVNFSLRGGRQGDHPRFLENNADNMASIIEDGGNANQQQTSFCLPVVMMGTESAAADNKEQEELLQLLRADFSTSNECANKMEEYRIKIAERIPQLFVNGAPVPVKIVDFTENDIANAINALVPSLAQERVAYGAERIAAKRTLLAKVIDVADELVTVLDHRAKRVAELKKAQDNKNGAQSDDAADVNKKNSSRQALMTGSDRARMLKLAKQTRHRFAEERASLNRLAASLSDNSAELASFLNGASRKYAAKALIRADMVGNVSAETVLNSLRDNAFVSELKAALAKDKELMAKRSADINENNVSCSIFSLQTAMETYEDWITILENPDAAVDPADVYSCLVAFSLFAHPVEFAKTAAAQMSPLQTFCLDIECGNLDTGSLFLAKQGSGSFNLKGQMGKKIEQAFALVDPSCPHISSLILRRSQIAQINNSVNICSDLFMVHPEQNFSQHVHTFAKAVEKYAIGTSKSRAYLGLAVKILYSFRRMFASGKAMTDKQTALLKRWLIDGSTITTSEEDGCDHPYALPFLLAACDLSAFLPSFGANADVVAVTDCVVSSRAPVMNLLNEWFARKCKMVLNRFAQAKNHANTTVAAFAALRQYFGVKASNSPSPLDDVLASEPSVEAVKESCQHWVDDGDLNPEILSGLFYGGEGGEAATVSSSRGVNTNNDSVEASIVKKELQQIYLACKFARALQLYFAHEQKSQSGVKDWKSLIAHMEQHLDIPASLGNFIDNMKIENDDILEKVISQSMFVKNDDDDAIMDNKKKSRIAAAATSVGPQFAHGTRQFYQSIIAQGMLYHDSSSRQQVDEHDVTDPVTLQDMVISLRMAVYFEKCQVKRAHYLSIIGDVTYASAMSAQESQFAGMLGVHTHGLSREKFWAFLRACEGSDAKALAFREKSNDTLKSETAFNCALGRALRKRN